MSAAMSFRPIMIPLYSFTVGLCAAAAGIMLALLLCNLGFEWGLIKANANIDDDAVLITVGWGMGGGLIGFIAGAVFSWRAITGKGG